MNHFKLGENKVNMKTKNMFLRDHGKLNSAWQDSQDTHLFICLTLYTWAAQRSWPSSN